MDRNKGSLRFKTKDQKKKSTCMPIVAEGKHFISQIRHIDTLVADRKLIEEVFTSHFEEAFSALPDSLNLEGLGLPCFDLSQLNAVFTEEQVLSVRIYNRIVFV
jgi:hypothetical protein